MNVGLNVGFSEIEKKVLESLVANGEYTAILLSKKLGVSERTIERAFAKLQKLNMIIRNGSKRDGKWIVLK